MTIDPPTTRLSMSSPAPLAGQEPLVARFPHASEPNTCGGQNPVDAQCVCAPAPHTLRTDRYMPPVSLVSAARFEAAGQKGFVTQDRAASDPHSTRDQSGFVSHESTVAGSPRVADQNCCVTQLGSVGTHSLLGTACSVSPEPEVFPARPTPATHTHMLPRRRLSLVRSSLRTGITVSPKTYLSATPSRSGPCANCHPAARCPDYTNPACGQCGSVHHHLHAARTFKGASHAS